MKIQQAVIMAAGLGKRILPFSHLCPKAFLPVMGIPVIRYAVDSLAEEGVQNIAVNIHTKPDWARQSIQGFQDSAVTFHISDEAELLLGSAGGVKKAFSLLDNSPFFLANADTLCGVEWSKLASHHFKLRDLYGVQLTLALFPQPKDSVSYSKIGFDPDTSLINGVKGNQESSYFYGGAAIIEPEALSEVKLNEPSQFVESILEKLISKKKAGCFISSGFWMDMGSPSLWLKTHLSLMDLLETDQLKKSSSGRAWMKRLLSENTRFKKHCWMSQGSVIPESVSIQAPSYLSLQLSSDDLVKTLGPQVVAYGSLPFPSLSHGIGYGGVWFPVKQSALS